MTSRHRRRARRWGRILRLRLRALRPLPQEDRDAAAKAILKAMPNHLIALDNVRRWPRNLYIYRKLKDAT